MAEVVSLIASVITIAALVIDGVKYAKDLHQAPEELVEVQVSGSRGTINRDQWTRPGLWER